MPANAAEWDARYGEAAQGPVGEPASIVSEWLPLLPKGPALDLACGSGRHAIPLAAGRRPVTAIDWSATGLDVLENRARKAKLHVRRAEASALAKPAEHRRSELLLIQANLEEIQLPVASFKVVVCVQYLQRSLFAPMSRALRPGGVLLFETFTRAQLNYFNGPRNPAYLLERRELRMAFPELHILFYRELNAGQGIASLVAQKP
jgi:tellurite methyltransferase